ncbi:hypothetical protein [Arthrobacter sp. A2-55]|uniref:hypothetical protein n=1 Tax=Arthrobacter sp. A2-55 TaxID=2897337 RepID=UPI0021CD3350|nr:hypothetical protein [Arthrobacter sp. A2-55]MCU6480531.1 hypothetical protein [Arthrobacter sp. A2-55]
MKPHLNVGQEVIVDEIGQPERRTCEFGCPHDVYQITRRALTIQTAVIKPWPKMPPEMAHAYPPDYAYFTAVDSDGTIWTKESRGAGYQWEAGERRAENIMIGGRTVTGFPATPTKATTFTNLTDAEVP